jgi:CelD/BcsL family acetyltransferase involved in cellulose biosynthesis
LRQRRECGILLNASISPRSQKLVRVTVLKKIPEDPDLSAAWNSLVLSMESPEVFFTYQWALAASRGFGKVLSTLLFLAYDLEELVGVAALAIDPRAPRAAFFLTSSTADYCDIVSTPGNRRAVILALLEEIRKVGLSDLVLANVPANSATLHELPQVAGTHRYYVTSRTAYNCGVVQLGGDDQRESLLRTLGSKNREKRALKRLTNLGAVKVIHVTEPGKIAASLESIVSAQISRFLASDRVSPLVGPERRAFLQQLSELLAESGWLKISQLEIDGRPVAWNYGFRFGGSWFWYLPTFELKYAQVSPGSCLLRLLVEEAARDTSLRWLDLGLGDESYKGRYANETRETRYIRVSHGFARHVVSVGRELLSAVATRFPRLGDTLREGQAFFYGLVTRVRDDGFAETVRYTMRRAVHSIASRDEVMLFEAEGLAQVDKDGFQLVPLLREHLVEASILNPDDKSTLRYLMRCSHRLARPGAAGFVLQDDAGRPVHFLWIENYNDFRLAEIEHNIESSGTNAAMIFDCWTPKAERGRGRYAEAIRRAASKLRREGRAAWIFSGATNTASVRGVLKAGFQYRFSFVRRTLLGHANVSVKEAAARAVTATRQKPRTSAA